MTRVGVQLLRPSGTTTATAFKPAAHASWTDGGAISLATADPEFVEAVPAGERARVVAALRLPLAVLATGPWAGPSAPWADGGRPVGLVVVDGLLSRTITVRDRASIELFGPGDVLIADETEPSPAGEHVEWEVHQPVQIAVLDDRFERITQRWPSLWGVVVRRTARRAERLAAQLGVLQLSRVEDRVEATLWLLADRWGRVTPDGVVVPLSLTHTLLGCLVSAKRPTVSLALTALGEQGAVTRGADGSFVLRR